MELRLRRSNRGDLALLELTGEIDLSSIPKLSDALHRLINDERGMLVAVDLDGVIAMEDVGLGIMLGAAATARQHGGDLVVIATSTLMLHRLAVTRFDRAVEVVASASAVGRSFGVAEPGPGDR